MTVAPKDVPRPPSLLRSVLPPTLFMLLCGIVGPIFVIVGLSVDEPGTGWLLPLGIAITVLDVVIGLVIGGLRHRSALRSHRLRQRGRPARAQVLSFEHTSVRINEQPLLKLRLRIEGEDIAPFEVESRQVVPDVRMPLLYGGELPALVDPETREWEVDWSSARPIAPGVVPVAAADARTPAERLAELDDLLRRDLVSREEYDAARARILGEL
ncbi:SHOCT domain-containing protein [Nocardioides humi]|nr:SHOCT domain-containing protein [Nocardioides humi]